MLPKSLPLVAAVLCALSCVNAQVTASSNGIVYNCPNVETIEVAYADDCPAFSRTMAFELTGVTSSVSYRGAPNSYSVPDGSYQLGCAYRIKGGTTDALICNYVAGSGIPLRQRDGSNGECPTPGQTFPQPSRRAEPRGLVKRFDQNLSLPLFALTLGEGIALTITEPAFNCPWNSDRSDRFVYTVSISSGTRSFVNDQGFRIRCTISQPSGFSPLSCTYRGDGTFVTSTGGANPADCPIRACAAVRNSRRSTKRGVYVGDDPINRRQVDSGKLRLQS